mgnify:CR=1 FL=1
MSSSLFHYTSIDTLEKILTNKTIGFKSLALVDDLDEAETADLKKFGKFCYVSCWTKEEEESIPMWKMYTPDMMGVRIELKEYPFKKYTLSPYQSENEKLIETYINVEERDKKDLPYILTEYPLLTEIDYTEREELLYPKVKNENISYIKDTIIENGERKTITKTSTSINYDIKYIGEFKRKCWSFQKEWRYKIFLAPYTLKELKNCKTSEDHIRLKQRLENENYKPHEEIIFLDLDNEAIKEMKILIGPKATQEHIKKVKQIAQISGIDEKNVKKSGLRIR